MPVSGPTEGDTSRRPTRNDVAALAGVSSAVVSYVMNDGPRNVAPATRQRVLDAVKELGYRPNDAARSLRSQRNAMVGLVGDSTMSSGLTAMTAGVTKVLSDQSYLLTVAHTGSDPAHNEQSLELLVARSDGALFVPSSESKELPKPLAQEGFPVVAVGAAVEGVPSVFVNPEASGFLATQHLLSLGHRRIGVICSASAESTGFSRGHVQALRDQGLLVDAALTVDAAVGINAGIAAVVGLVDRAEPVTAFVVENDLTALGVLDGLHQRELSVPADVSMVSVDDLELCQHLTPPLTTVPYRGEEVGQIATQLLLELINGEPVVPSTVVPPTIVVRASTGPR